MQEIIKEAACFCTACLSGVVVYLAYQILFLLRKLIPHSQMGVDAEDLVYWIMTACYLFYQIYVTMSGRIRWHFVTGVVMGIVFAKLIFFCGKNFYIKIQKSLEKKAKRR